MTLAAAAPFAVANWKLEEASGSRADSVGANTLTDNNTVGSGTGKFGTAADFEAGSSEYLSITDNAALSTGDVALTFRVWLNPESFGETKVVGIKGTSIDGANTYEWALVILSTGNLFPMVSEGVNRAFFDSGLTLSTGSWQLVHFIHDPTANVYGVALNAGTIQTNSYSAGLWDSGTAFHLGGEPGTRLYDGLMDDPVILKGYVLDATERTADYNSGTGVEFASWAGAATNTEFGVRTILPNNRVGPPVLRRMWRQPGMTLNASAAAASGNRRRRAILSRG